MGIARQKKETKSSLRGDEWTRLSISVWDDISKNQEERQLKHPAMFPSALTRRLIKIFSPGEDEVILDPFLGVGSTLAGAAFEGRSGLGFEIVPDFATKAWKRLHNQYCGFFPKYKIHFLDKPTQLRFVAGEKSLAIFHLDARRMTECLASEEVHLCITSPPYWNILTRKRTADYKEKRKYSNLPEDLGNIADYTVFLKELDSIFRQVRDILVPGRYMVVVVMDIRQGPKFIPYHMDIANHVVSLGFTFEDIIIWDRRKEYNNLRPLGYPYKFIVNKTHEYILIFRKPK